MSTQYDTIQKSYEHIRETPSAIIRKEHVKNQLQPFIRGARVLDLACGSGGFTFDLLEWGASSVVGVDISPVMIEAAEAKGRHLAAKLKNGHSSVPNGVPNGKPLLEDKVKFLVADCTKPMLYEGAPYDLVFAAWLLNYAPDKEAMTAMFRTVALNLKDGGYFFTIIPPNSNNPRKTIEDHNAIRPPRERKGGFFADSIDDVPDGILVHYVGYTASGGDVRINTYHLTQAAHEQAARDGGLRGELKWIRQKVPEKFLTGEVSLGVSVKELATYDVEPDHALLAVRK